MASFLVLYDTVVGRPSRRPWSRVELVGWARAGARGLTDPSLLPEELAPLLVCRYLETVWVRGWVRGWVGVNFRPKEARVSISLNPALTI